MFAAGSESSDEEVPKVRGHIERAPISNEDRWQPDAEDLNGHLNSGAGTSGRADTGRLEQGYRSHREVDRSRIYHENRRSHGRDNARPERRNDSPRDSRRVRGSPGPSKRDRGSHHQPAGLSRMR